MVDIYEHTIENNSFDKILAKKCQYLICVNNKNVQSYQVGNILTLKNNDGASAKARIKNFLYFTNIKELANTIGKQKCGFSAGVNLDKLEDEYNHTFEPKQIDKFGFVAIEFELV